MALRRLAAAALCAAGLLAALPTSAQGERTIRISVATPQGHTMTEGANRFAQLLQDKSQGRLKARVFPGAVLGGDVPVIASLKGGSIDATIVSAGIVAQTVKDFNLLVMPSIFDDRNEADALLDGPYGRKLLDKLPANGLVGLAYLEHGYKHVSNSKRAVTKWEDLDGLKLRVIQVASVVDVFKQLGANPVPLAFAELYGALEQKAVDGQENTLITIDAAKLYEVQKYLTLTYHIYDPLVLVFSKPVWDKLSEADRAAVQKAAQEASAYQRQINRAKEAEILKLLADKGLTITELSPQERARLKERLAPVLDKHARAVGDAEVKEFFAELDRARRAAK